MCSTSFSNLDNIKTTIINDSVIMVNHITKLNTRDIICHKYNKKFVMYITISRRILIFNNI